MCDRSDYGAFGFWWMVVSDHLFAEYGSLNMFYIAFDGFDLFQLHFETREAAQKHLDDNYMKLARHCLYCVAVYEK